MTNFVIHGPLHDFSNSLKDLIFSRFPKILGSFSQCQIYIYHIFYISHFQISTFSHFPKNLAKYTLKVNHYKFKHNNGTRQHLYIITMQTEGEGWHMGTIFPTPNHFGPSPPFPKILGFFAPQFPIYTLPPFLNFPFPSFQIFPKFSQILLMIKVPLVTR